MSKHEIPIAYHRRLAAEHQRAWEQEMAAPNGAQRSLLLMHCSDRDYHLSIVKSLALAASLAPKEVEDA